jgi:hypothetical protein
VQTAIRVAFLALALSFGVDVLDARAPARTRERLIVLNAPSTISQGFDSVLAFTLRGKGAVMLGAEQERLGLSDIACRSTKPFHVLVGHADFAARTSGFLILNRAGRLLHTLPSGLAAGPISIAYDPSGVLYTLTIPQAVFRNHVELVRLPDDLSIARVAVDSQGNAYITSPRSFPPQPKVLRVDPSGNVSVFADETQGLANPFGIAVDSEDNVFVANAYPAGAAFILKFDPSGAASVFASDFSGELSRGLAFDADGNLYATLGGNNMIMKFTKTGERSVFADAADGLNFPAAIEVCAG